MSEKKEPDYIQDLTERPEVCEHPQNNLIQSKTDITGCFFWYCPKCNTSFSSYEFGEIRRQQNLKKQNGE